MSQHAVSHFGLQKYNVYFEWRKKISTIILMLLIYKRERDSFQSLFVELEKKGTAGDSSASERGGEPRSGIPNCMKNPCFRLTPAKQKRPVKGILFVELEGVVVCPASQTSKPSSVWARVRRVWVELEGVVVCPASQTSKPSSVWARVRRVWVELEGVEPSSKQVTNLLSTCLSGGWL